MSTIAQQPELGFSHHDHLVDPKDWIPLKLLCEELEQEISTRRVHLLRKLSNWLFTLGLFKRIQRQKITCCQGHPHHRDLEYQRVILAMLLGTGEAIQMDLREHTNIDPEVIDVSFASVSAAIKELQYDMNSWHGDMTEARVTDILDYVGGRKA
jgi:hypothetical protein